MFAYFSWWYAKEPVILWNSILIIIEKIYHVFSVPVLLRTLFDPWKRDISYVEEASLDIVARIALENLVSRLMGFLVRTVTILIGLLVTVLSFVAMILFIVFWLIMPILSVYLIISGITTGVNGEI